MPHPKRLIEVDLPIKTISAHARREKSIRHGHISTLHIWWARRPLAACRAVLCAALWPDPADPDCPPAFREAAAKLITAFARKVVSDRSLAESCSPAAFGRWNTLSRQEAAFDLSQANHLNVLRYALLDFIGDFANWDNSTVPAYLETARLLTHIAHLALTNPDFQLPPLDWSNPQLAIHNLQSQISHLPRPLVVDPFAGGGAIPLEALRIGADAFASDLNPVAVLLNKVVLEYIPKYGKSEVRIQKPEGGELVLDGLAEAVRYWGNWIKERAAKELAEFYPKDPDGSTPIAYLWARTIRCEGPACGAEVPLMRSLWLAKKGERSVALRLVPDKKHKRVDFEIIQTRNGKWYPRSEISNPKSEIKNPQFDGTVKRGSATCPVCGYTTPVARVRAQLRARRGGANDARLFCVVTTKPTEQGRFYRLPTDRDLEAVRKAAEELEQRKQAHTGPLSLVPDEPFTGLEPRRIPLPQYGITSFGDLFNARQSLALVSLCRLVNESGPEMGLQENDPLRIALQACLAISVDRQADKLSSLARWDNTRENPQGTFGRQALPMVWDFNEVNPFSGSGGDWDTAINWILLVIEQKAKSRFQQGHVERASAIAHPLPDDLADAFITDPPYYYSVPYSDLSDFFYVWLRRSLGNSQTDLLKFNVTPKEDECVQNLPHSEVAHLQKSRDFYEQTLQRALSEGMRIAKPDSIGTIIFAHSNTEAWESLLAALVASGWCVTASWPIDTEMANRMLTQRQSTLASSIHLVCRPREKPYAKLQRSPIGDWRDVLATLPKRIQEWMPRLAKEGVVGADAIFACLGPALEIFSQYERVETAGGKKIELREYLEHVWAAVGREALNQIFAGADPTGFEEDARLTVIWFWALQPAWNGAAPDKSAEDALNGASGDAEVEEEEMPAEGNGKKKPTGYSMEYDTARKLAQGLGVDLQRLSRPGGIVAIKGNIATLNSVTAREQFLIGFQLSMFRDRDTTARQSHGKRSRPVAILKDVENRQAALFDPRPEPRKDPNNPYLPGLEPPKDGRTLLERLIDNGSTLIDRLHQAMLLFARGQTALLGPFMVQANVAQDMRFWRLAQALSALYPAASQEKRWVDGVLARKKGLGL